MRLFLLAVLTGCAASEPPAPAPADAAVDTHSDAAFDATIDAPFDVAPDAKDAACKLVKPYSSKNAACNACAEASCCAEVNGCLADKRCDDDYVNCILACALLPEDGGKEAIEACIADCGKKHPEGKALYDAAIGCVEATCKDTCK